MSGLIHCSSTPGSLQKCFSSPSTFLHPFTSTEYPMLCQRCKGGHFWGDFWFLFCFVGQKRTDSILNSTFQSFSIPYVPLLLILFSLSSVASPPVLATVKTFCCCLAGILLFPLFKYTFLCCK